MRRKHQWWVVGSIGCDKVVWYIVLYGSITDTHV